MLSASEALTQLPDLDILFTQNSGHERLGLAVSGGADSMALMLLVRRWAAEQLHPPHCVVYTVDHGLRPEAGAETAFVAEEAARLGFDTRVLCWSGPHPRSGVLAAAREARYRLIAEAARADSISVVLTAHHRNDQAETILMRLAHGSGISGLSGMAARTEIAGIEVFRPLLGIAPETLRALVAEAGITPVHDPSNADTNYERIRWRQAAPALADLGMDVDTLLRFSRRAERADDALRYYARDAFAGVAEIGMFGEVRLDLNPLAGLPEEVRLRVLGRGLEIAGGGRGRHALGPLERLNREVFSGTARRGQTLSGCRIAYSGDSLTITREMARIDGEPLEIAAGQTGIWDQRFSITLGNQLAGALVVPARSMTRDQAELLLSQPVLVAMSAVRAAPLVVGASGRALALGSHTFDPAILVRVLQAA
jgi:tRNA(Ile)-lysidine synthase